MTLDCKWWMEIIVAFPFVFHVQLAFNSALSNHSFAKNHKTFLSECLGRDLKGEQLRHVEVKGGGFVLVYVLTEGRHSGVCTYMV